jgi:hypothetical protein
MMSYTFELFPSTEALGINKTIRPMTPFQVQNYEFRGHHPIMEGQEKNIFTKQ